MISGYIVHPEISQRLPRGHSEITLYKYKKSMFVEEWDPELLLCQALLSHGWPAKSAEGWGLICVWVCVCIFSAFVFAEGCRLSRSPLLGLRRVAD